MDDLSELTDAALLQAAIDDPDAFGLFYDRHAQPVLQFLYRRTDSAETAADLCAETFAAAFVQRQTFRDTGTSAPPWLILRVGQDLPYGIAGERARTARRRRIASAALVVVLVAGAGLAFASPPYAHRVTYMHDNPDPRSGARPGLPTSRYSTTIPRRATRSLT